METSEVYLKAMMSLIARQTFGPERLCEIVSPVGNLKSMEAFNLCDGTRLQAEVCLAVGLDNGNFSKQIKRWLDEGVVIKVVQDGKERPVHVYPLPDRFLIAAKKKVKTEDGQ